MRLSNLLKFEIPFPFRPKTMPSHLLRIGFGLILFCSPLSAAAAGAGNDSRPIDIENPRQAVKQAEKLVRKGKLVEAGQILRQLVERNPGDLKAKIKLAFVLMKQKRLVEAYNFSIEVVRAEPRNSYAFAVLGMTLLGAGNFKESTVCFVNALELDKSQALAWAGLGLLDFYENRIERSLDNLAMAVYRDPEEPDYVFTYAQVSARGEKYRQAADAYDRFLEVAPQTDVERRARIRGLINFLRYLGNKQALYIAAGEQKTTVPIRLVRDRPVIQLKIDKHEQPFNFVLDTGSGISVISDEVAKRLKIKPITKGGLARAIGGDGKFQIVYGFLRSISIGQVKIQNVPVYIRKFHENNQNVDGYIGLGLISKFLTTLDYGAQTFSLVRRTEAAVPESHANMSLPLRLTSSGYLSGEVQLEGVQTPLNFIVDTGASISVISNDLAELNEVNKHISDEKMRVVGAAGVTDGVSVFLLPRVTFGSYSREKVRAIALDLDMINETSGFEQAGILGGNFLKNYRLTFDFKNSRLSFEPLSDSTATSGLKP